MRLPLIMFAAVAFAAAPASAQVDDGFDDRGVDRHDRAPDWNYRRGESAGKGSYYDGGRYGPRGLLSDSTASYPWLAERRFAKLADRNRDSRLTDEEIAFALNAVRKSDRRNKERAK